ncbi:MAG: HAD family hydrolase [Deltaproteobacteria bacterium]|nr:HAD family hydrolase [Deltaproteobacteria bacterium]
MSFRAIIFDMDGTLLDTIGGIAFAMNNVLGRLGFPAHPENDYKFLVGEGVDILIRRALPEGACDEDVFNRAIAYLREEYSRNWRHKTAPYPGIPELLDELTARAIKTAILSNKPDEFTKAMAAGLLGRWEFGAVIGARTDLPRKPDPAGALEISRLLAVPRDSFLYVGDSATDMQTALAAGMYPIGVKWGFRSEEEMLSAGARRIIGHPMEILELLG